MEKIIEKTIKTALTQWKEQEREILEEAYEDR